MKVLIFNLLLILVHTTYAEEIDLFVLAGQSNMQGWQGNAEHYPADPLKIDPTIKFYWNTPQHSSSKEQWTHLKPQGGRFPKGHFGPEITLGRILTKKHKSIAIFKYSLGSTGLEDHWKKPKQNGLYDQMNAELEKAIALLKLEGHKVTLKGFFWVQGESDTVSAKIASNYGTNLKLLISDFRKNIANNNNLPFIIGVDEQHPGITKFPIIVTSQQKIAGGDPFIIFTSMIGLQKADATHLTPAGIEEHGLRLFAAYDQISPSKR
jgi:hypothetical protein